MNYEWVSLPPINRALIVTDGARSQVCYWVGGKYGFLNPGGFELDKDYKPTHWMLLPDPPK